MEGQIYLRPACEKFSKAIYIKVCNIQYLENVLKILEEELGLKPRKEHETILNVYDVVYVGIRIMDGELLQIYFRDVEILEEIIKPLNYNFQDFKDVCLVNTIKCNRQILTDELFGEYFENFIIETTQKAKTKSKKEILNETPNENKNLNNKIINERGINMKTNNLFNGAMKNMQFGKIETEEIKYSFKGIAYKTNDDTYVCYDVATEELTDVNQMVFDMPIMVMPLAKKDLKVGDIIQHNNQFVIVKEIKDKSIDAIKPNVQEIVQIIPSKSIFGFDFYSKVVNIFENISTDANQDNPFGNMLPMLMMSSKEDNDMNSMLPMLMMNNSLDMNTILPLMMMGGDNKDMMSTFMMMQMVNKK